MVTFEFLFDFETKNTPANLIEIGEVFTPKSFVSNAYIC